MATMALFKDGIPYWEIHVTSSEGWERIGVERTEERARQAYIGYQGSGGSYAERGMRLVKYTPEILDSKPDTLWDYGFSGEDKTSGIKD